MAKAKWTRQYKRRKSTAHPIIKRMRRREEMAKRRPKTSEAKKDMKSRKKGAIELTPDKYFILHGGTPIKSIEDLAMMLDTMSDEDFSYHVAGEKNDFSNWISDVFGRKDLADALMPIKDKKESQIVLLKHALAKGKHA